MPPEAPLALDQVHDIPIELLLPTPGNRDVGDVTDLTASIQEDGILQPLCARPRHEDAEIESYELVFGNRRLAAAVSLGLPSAPVRIIECSDEKARELAIVENIQRRDLHPMEEADAIERLQRDHGLTVEEIAAKLGKPAPYVYGRLKLTSLSPESRTRFLAGEFGAGIALLVARIPNEKLQAEAIAELGSDEHRDAMSLSAATAYVQQHYMLRLADASFNTEDAHLVPAAGACSVCPKRTGNQAALFGDVASKDLCTDTACFKAKRDADWEEQKRSATRDGTRVLTDKEAKKLFPIANALHVPESSGFVALDAKHYDPEGKGGKTFQQVLGKKVAELPIVLVRDPVGNVRRLAVAADVAKALKDANKYVPRAVERPPSAMSDGQKKEALDRKVKGLTSSRVLDAIVVKCETSPKGALLLVVQALAAVAWDDTAHTICQRRGIELDRKQDAKLTLKKIAGDMKGNEAHLFALALEIGLAQVREGTLAEAAAHFKIDPKRIAQDVRAELVAKTTAKTAAKKKPAKKTAAPKKSAAASEEAAVWEREAAQRLGKKKAAKKGASK